MRAAGAWLQARPQLGIDVFARPQPVAAARGRLCRADGGLSRAAAGPGGRGQKRRRSIDRLPRWLWRVPDALARVRALLTSIRPGAPLIGFCRRSRRTIPSTDSRRAPRWRARLSPAWSSPGMARPTSTRGRPSDRFTCRRRAVGRRPGATPCRPDVRREHQPADIGPRVVARRRPLARARGRAAASRIRPASAITALSRSAGFVGSVPRQAPAERSWMDAWPDTMMRRGLA